MRLSDAIRLGAMLKPQAIGQMQSYGGHRTCALGAAREAGFPIVENTRTGYAVEACPLRLFACPTRHPGCRWWHGLYRTIVHLNDVHHWTREAIADWVETIEGETLNPPEGGLRGDRVAEST